MFWNGPPLLPFPGSPPIFSLLPTSWLHGYQAVTGLDLSFTRWIIPGGFLHPCNLLTSVHQCLTVGCKRSNWEVRVVRDISHLFLWEIPLAWLRWFLRLLFMWFPMERMLPHKCFWVSALIVITILVTPSPKSQRSNFRCSIPVVPFMCWQME